MSKVRLPYKDYKLYKKDKDALASSAEDLMTELEEACETYIESINDSDDVIELMEHKRSFLLKLIEKLPISGNHCVFCARSNMEDTTCAECMWAKTGKGQCSKERSAWKRVVRAQTQLEQTVSAEYFWYPEVEDQNKCY